MAAFSVSSRKAVDEAYTAAISVGAEDEGAPGLRPNFEPDHYGAYVRDLDGNKLHFNYGLDYGAALRPTGSFKTGPAEQGERGSQSPNCLDYCDRTGPV